jgi:amino acid adenylation domain-containing protein
LSSILKISPRALIVEAGAQSPAIAVAQARGSQIIRLHRALEEEAGVFRLDFSAPVTGVAPVFAAGDDETLALHTSGTTGRPKIVPLTHASLLASARSIAASLALTSSDRCLNVMPLFHVHGLVGALLASLTVGGSVVCAPGFQSPTFLSWCEEFEPTWYTAVPTMHQAILARAVENRSRLADLKLRFTRSCSAPLPPALTAEMEATFGVPVIEAYGMTEASHQIATNPLPPGERKPGSVGLACGTEVAVIDQRSNTLAPGETGEIVIRGPGVIAGYAENPEANRDSFVNGWFRTGDEGRIDSEGYVFITGRTKEMINRGGQKISPREIDEVLGSHPAVAQAIAFAMPDRRLGEDVAAAVALRPGKSVTEIQLRNHAEQFLADFKVPRKIIFVDDIPKGPTGKPKRIGLAEQLGLGDAGTSASGPAEFVTPRTPTEKLLAGIWGQVLRLERIGINDGFLALGGDSMLAALAIARIRDAIGARVSMLTFFEHPTIAMLGAAIDGGETEQTVASEPIVAAPANGELPLSSAQRRVWFLAQLDETRCAYNRCDVYRLRGSLQVPALTASLGKIVERHSILRTTYHSGDDEPCQIVQPAAPFQLDELDLANLPLNEELSSAIATAGEEAQREFDLARSPMLRARLIRLGSDDHVLVVTMHHIASDGWSSEVLLAELAAHYAAALREVSAELPPVPFQYTDFAVWQLRTMQGSAFDESLEWWRKRLSEAPALLELATDRPRPPVQNLQGSAENFVLPKQICHRIKDLARVEHATLFMTLLAAFYALLHRYSGADDIVVGTPIAGRIRTEAEGLIGLFVNILAIRTSLSGKPTFRELLQRTRMSAIEALSHQDVPFEKVVEVLHPQRNLSYAPIFQTTFQLRNYPLEGTKFAGINVEKVDFDSASSQFDLSLEVTEKADGLFCKFIYSTGLFDRETIAAMARHFETLLCEIVADPDTRISELSMLGADERDRIIVDWNDTRRDYHSDCLHRLFEQQTARTPHAVAVEFGASRLTYAELSRHSNRAADLLHGAGVRRGSIVGLCVDRSPEMYVGLLAIPKAGGAYVPLDPSYPPARLEFMLDDSGASVLATTRRHSTKFANRMLKVVELDSLSPSRAPADRGALSNSAIDDAAYVIYTSGSTGMPKGVIGAHRGVVNRLQWMWETYPYADGERACQKTALSFVDSVAEIFGPLLAGVPTSIIDDEIVRDPRRLVESLARSAVTRIVMVPSLLEAILDLPIDLEGPLHKLRFWTSSGETLRGDLAERFFERLPHARLLNLYGSSEVAADALAYELPAGPYLTNPPIGRPIANTRVYVLGPSREPVPIGAAGEICIGGAGLASGYHNRPELTAARFVEDPFARSTIGRIFRTGDLGRYRRDGLLEFLGRADNQIKVSGVRIEPEEVETVLRNHPQVRAAAVSAIGDPGAGRRLVAWVVARSDPPPSAAAVREFAKRYLPEQIVPSRIAWIDHIPQTPSGKIDRAGLSAFRDALSVSTDEILEPRDDIEAGLRTIWESVLGVRPIGVTQDFFDLGGHSLMAARLFAQIERKFARRLPLAVIFQAPTIEGVARIVRDANYKDHANLLVPIQPLGTQPTLYAIGSFNVFRLLAKHMGTDQPVLGVAIPDNLMFRLPYQIEELATAYVTSILSAPANGPICIAGFSADGVLAYEVARRLTEAGHGVDLLVLLDSPCPAEPLDPLVTRFARNTNIHIRNLVRSGLRRSGRILNEISRRVWLRIKVRALRVLSRLGIQSVRPTPQRPMDAILAMVIATRALVPKPYHGRVLLFRRTQDLTGRYRLPDYGWSRIVPGGPEIVDIPGGHLSVVAEPGIALVAEKLRAVIRDTFKTTQAPLGRVG